MRPLKFAVALATVATVIVGAQSGAQASGSKSHSTTYPAAIQQQIAAIKAKGGIILAVEHVDYVRSSDPSLAPLKFGPSTSDAPAAVHPNAFPSGCGLFVTIARYGNEIDGSSLTSCTTPAEYIVMAAGLARHRWDGWEELTQEEHENEGESSLSFDLWYDCTGTGTHVFEVSTEGELEIYGEEYEAEAYDQTGNETC